MNDRSIEDLVRRSYADHEHLAEPDRELDVMARARAQGAEVRSLRPPRRRLGAVLAGVAAACVLLAVVVGGTLLASRDGRDVTADEPRPQDVTALAQRLRRGVEEAGTMTVRFQTPGTDRKGALRLDLRDPSVPRMDMRLDGRRLPVGVLHEGSWWHGNGDDSFHEEQLAGTDLVWVALQELTVPPRRARHLGTGTVDGVPADHVVVTTVVEVAMDTPVGPSSRPEEEHLDLWIGQDSHRILRAALEPARSEQGTTLTVTYGEEMKVPSLAEVVAAARE